MEFERTKKSLKDRAKEFGSQLPFMDGRNKGDSGDLVGMVSTIRDYGFLNGDDNHEYVVFIVDEDQKSFFFGGSVLTDQMRKLDDEDYGDEIRRDGLPMLLSEKKSRNNRKYINVEFYPD